jgi:hypothetical protein
MPPTILHQFWAFIEDTQTTTLLNLDDASLVRCLIGQFLRQNTLNTEEANTLSTYVSGRLPLIRELAQERSPAYQ